MTEFFGSNVKQEVAATEIVHAIPTLNGVLHCGG
jgi:hypothetical protein